MGKKIFIGGTGRSGTTILSKYLGAHKDIYRIPFESRFLTDKDGIIDLFISLTDNFSMNQGRIAIRRFFKMMEDLSSPYSTPYVGKHYKKNFGEIKMQENLTKLLISITCDSFKGQDYRTLDRYNSMALVRFILKPLNNITVKLYNVIAGTKKYNLPLSIINFGYPKEEIFIPKYFRNEKKLGIILNQFVDTLFKDQAEDDNKNHWCEKTPANALHFDTLSKIFPEAYFIHIVRHPVGVAQSMKKMGWAPDNYKQICDVLENLYEKLITIEEANKRNNKFKYLRVKLEGLTNDNTINMIVNFLGVTNEFSDNIIFKDAKINYYKDKISRKHSEYIKDRLEKYINYFSY